MGVLKKTVRVFLLPVKVKMKKKKKLLFVFRFFAESLRVAI